ncbi:sushi, von Willebrand factor type A, EGF and pentraxin domain-containing protein 1-like isoform X2 [Ornithodoros turicata]|uniref:sushi, von Willebrand factor type A, EGF and pentraxin domain-containing protein 1-like isoform X2 n=1 Tax=Ornithodoros turicata TaxID=34597 RepID=UPI0031395F97
MLPTRELLLLLVTLCSVDSVQLNVEESLSDFASTLEQYATQKNDVVFVLDESGSVGVENFPHELEMVEVIARMLTVSPDFSRIAVMTFSSGYVDHIDHIKNSTGYSMCSLIARVRGIPYTGGWTQTSRALSHAKDILINSRPQSNRIIILISDGDANAEYSPSDIASRLRKEGVVMFAVGVASINAAELLDVATSPKHVYMLEDFTYITEINQKLRDDVKETHFDVSSSSMACNNPRCDSNAACACGARGGKYQCVCERGYFGMGGVGQCHPCPKGTYKDELGEHCKSCPKNSTTSGTGATSNAQCSCLEGYEGDPGSSKPCTPIACARLSPPEGGRIIPPNCGNTFGTSCDFLCKEGYCPYRCDAEALAAGTKPWNTLTKTPRVCQTDRLWSGTEFICEKVRCPALKNPKNAVINCANSSLEYGTECVINCDEGYEKIGGDILFCESNGQWRGNLPTCRAITCRPLQPKGRLKLQPSHCKNISKFNKICTYSCRNEGFTLLDKRTQKETDGVFRCLADGNWSHSIDNLRCKDIQPPRITCPKDILTHTLPNVPYSGQIAWESPTAKDNVAVSAIRIIEPLTLSAPADEPPLAPPGQFHLGETRVTYVAEDTSRLRSTPCAFFVRVTDNDPPKVMFCPDDIVIQYHKRSKTVSWAEPKFVDNAGTADLAIISSRAPGTLFSWGPKSEVSYNATDAAGNSATCSFGVTILPYLCPEFPPPRNGYVSCDSESRRQVCTVHCHVGYRFVFPPEPVYRCKQIQGGGVWATGTKKETGKPSRRVGTQRIEIRLPWPDCAVAQQPAKSAVQVVSTVATTSCDIDPAKLKLIKQQFIDELKRSGKANLICGPRLGECTVEKVHISCNDSAPTRSSDRRFRRENRQFGGARVISKRAVATLETANQLEEDVPLDPRLEAQLTISFSVDLPTDADLKTLLDECEICKNETIVHPSNAEAAAVGVALKSAVLEAVDTAIRKELPDAVIIGAEDTIVSECATGQVSNALNCVNCPVGTYYVNSTSCLPCPIGSYAVREASLSCTSCAQGRTTLSEKSSSPSDCKGLCPPGYYSRSGREPCVVCPEGEYQELYGQSECSKCPDGLTTASWASTSKKNCTGSCPRGTISRSGLMPCSPCPKGTYQTQEGQTSCSQCPSGESTNTSASTSESDCFVLNLCQRLHPCAEGATCVDETHSYSCECLDGLEGADCRINIDDCEPDLCLNGGRCIDGIDNVTCKCPKGYSGLSCEVNVDDCDPNPCAHGGTCVDGVNSFACKCPEGFTGKRCEHMTRHCINKPCQNGGTCFDYAKGFRCCCPEEFTGKTCELPYDPCADKPCQNGGQCEAHEHSPSSFQCVCAHGYTGEECESNIDDCASGPCLNGGTCVDGVASYTCQCPELYEGPSCETTKRAPVPAPYTLSFPNGYVSDYARVSVERNLRGLTVSFFMRTSQRDKRGTPVSYAFKHPGLNTVLDNAFALSDPNRLLLYFYQNSTDTGIAANDNRWHHCALTWSSETGIWVFYWDGEEKASDKSPASKGSYMFKGDVVLGQDQDSVGGGFSGLESFAGEIAELNVWDYTMPKDDVRQLGSTCGLVGNVVAWYAVRESIYGNALVTEGSPDFCSGHDCSNSSCHCSALSAVERNTCDKAVDACTHNPCKHNQVCTELSDGKGLCKCRGYEGRHCEFDIDECVTGEHACSHICVNTLGSYECSCPQGMVLNLDNKTCADSSYCTQGDTVYLVGDTWIQDCQHCTCDEGLITCSPALCKNVTCPKGQMVVHNPGDCCPSCSEEPLKCHLSGNGTLITFYQLVVPFVGREDNTLFQDCVNGDFIAYLDSSSDHKSVQLYIHCLSVTLYDNKTVLVNNNAVALPHKETSIVEIIEVENDQSVQVQTHGGVVVQLQSDGSFSVSAPKKLSVHMCGLCGSMNRDTGEYVQTTNHAPFFFSHSWMVAVVVVVVVVVVVAVAARAIKRHVWRLHPDTRTGNRSAPPPCAASGLSNAEVPLLLGVRSPGANTCAQTFELGRSSNPNSRQCGERETEEHIMMLCPATSDARRELQKAVPHPRT